MRAQIDLAWLCHEAHQAWAQPLLTQLQPALNRIKVHPLSEMGADAGNLEAEGALRVPPMSSAGIAYSVVGLRRYDALVLTVSLETLAWTRQWLAALPRRLGVPLIGVLNELRSHALLDLLELGMQDFVRTPVCPHEFRARLIHAVASAARPIAFRQPPARYALSEPDPRCPSQARPDGRTAVREPVLQFSELAWPDLGFQEQKQRMIDLFERQYLRKALRQAHGNISEAARRSRKDRRSFWELMRRHGISADPALEQR
jgi:hypothetical protein